VDGQVLLLVHTPLPTPLSYPRDNFSINPVTVETIVVIIVVTSRSKELITLFLSYMQC
jgi:hypothetical protein